MSYTSCTEYQRIPLSCKGKRKAFKAGWEAQSCERPSDENPYDPRVKNQLPTNPYYKYWALGWECAKEADAVEEIRKEDERFEELMYLSQAYFYNHGK
jgi:hypothetical protein